MPDSGPTATNIQVALSGLSGFKKEHMKLGRKVVCWGRGDELEGREWVSRYDQNTLYMYLDFQ